MLQECVIDMRAFFLSRCNDFRIHIPPIETIQRIHNVRIVPDIGSNPAAKLNELCKLRKVDISGYVSDYGEEWHGIRLYCVAEDEIDQQDGSLTPIGLNRIISKPGKLCPPDLADHSYSRALFSHWRLGAERQAKYDLVSLVVVKSLRRRVKREWVSSYRYPILLGYIHFF